MDEGPWALQRALQPLVLPWTEVKGFLGCSEASGFACISLSLFLPPSLYFLFSFFPSFSLITLILSRFSYFHLKLDIKSMKEGIILYAALDPTLDSDIEKNLIIFCGRANSTESKVAGQCDVRKLNLKEQRPPHLILKAKNLINTYSHEIYKLA